MKEKFLYTDEDEAMDAMYAETMTDPAARKDERPRKKSRRDHMAVGVPIICCQMLAITLLSGREIQHAKDCPNHR